MRIDILTLFPETFPAVLGCSMLRIAHEKGLLETQIHDLRDWTHDTHRTVDDRPFGGGPGMVLMVDPVVRAIRDIRGRTSDPGRLLLTSPAGRSFNQALARELSMEKRILIVAGRYEGYDERIIELLKPEEVSIGDYVLTGGELPALVVIDAVVRLIPGVVGHPDATAQESFGEDGRLDYPQYTRPVEYEGLRVPDILRSGDHGKVDAWRREESERRTRTRRPDLYPKGNPTCESP